MAEISIEASKFIRNVNWGQQIYSLHIAMEKYQFWCTCSSSWSVVMLILYTLFLKNKLFKMYLHIYKQYIEENSKCLFFILQWHCYHIVCTLDIRPSARLIVTKFWSKHFLKKKKRKKACIYSLYVNFFLAILPPCLLQKDSSVQEVVI